MCCARVATVSLEAITHLQCPAEPRFGQAPGPPRRVLCVVGWKSVSREADGAKRSGLTGPWTAGQSRDVMADVHSAVLHVSHSYSDRGALMEQEAGGATVEAAAVQESERARAHNQERTFPAKPDCETSSRRIIRLTRRCAPRMATTKDAAAGRARHASGA